MNWNDKKERRLYFKTYYLKNRERVDKYRREWQNNNREKYLTNRRKWRQRHRSRLLIKEAKYREKHRERLRIASRLWHQQHPEQEILHRWKRYGLDFTLEQYFVLLRSQHNRCAICKGKLCCGKKMFDVDHDHITKTVRGLLCHKCNPALGLFKDNATLLRSAANYLDQTKVKNK